MAQNIEMNYYDGSQYVALYPLCDLSNVTGNLSSGYISGSLSSSQIPNLDTSKITSGTFSTSRIPTINISSGTSGYLPASRVSGLSSGGVKNSGTYTGTKTNSVTINCGYADIIFICARYGYIYFGMRNSRYFVPFNSDYGDSFDFQSSSVIITNSVNSGLFNQNYLYYWYTI